MLTYLLLVIGSSCHPYPQNIDPKKHYTPADFPLFNLTYSEELVLASDVPPLPNVKETDIFK